MNNFMLVPSKTGAPGAEEELSNAINAHLLRAAQTSAGVGR